MTPKLLLIFVLILFISCKEKNVDYDQHNCSHGCNHDEHVQEELLSNLFYSIGKNQSLMVDGYVTEIEDLNTVNENGYTPLCLAVLYLQFQNHFRIVNSIIDAGADVNAPASDGRTPIVWASGIGHIPAIKLLLEKGADINYNESGTALMEAVKMGHENTIAYLLNNGADLQAINVNGKTALNIALEKGNENIIELLNSYK